MILKNRLYSQRAVSMVEVIVSAILFAAAAAGVFATISYTGKTATSHSRLEAALLSKKVLDQLSKEVNETTWASGALTVNTTHTWPADPDFPGYTATYTVSDVNGARKVDVDVAW
jgi:Tfp pilus assembly protein PilV